MKGIAGHIALALLGLVFAAGVGVAARELSSQDVGLSAEPITVGEDLAPTRTESTRAVKTRGSRRDRESTTTTPRPEAPPVRTDDDRAGDDESDSGSRGGEESESGSSDSRSGDDSGSGSGNGSGQDD